MRFEFATATRIIFGAGTLSELGAIVASMGKCALVVIGCSPENAEKLFAVLDEAGVRHVPFNVCGEPTVTLAREGVALAAQEGCDLVIGFGGGSAVDTGKAIAALATNPGDPVDYLEVIGAGKPITQPPLPYIAIPTTSGTGAEVTRNAVLASEEHQVKVSLRSPLMLPRLALVDPEMTYTVPPEVTASTGMDALTQVLEPYVSHKANPMTDAFCREGLTRAGRSLRRAYEQGDPQSREDMALTSLLSGLALANAALGAVHGFAGPLGGMFPIPHGVACARLLPYVMETNVRALRQRDPQNPALRRYQEVAEILTGKPGATAEEGVEWVTTLCHDLKIAGLSAFGIERKDFPDIVEKSMKASSMKGNPLVLTADELTGILEQAM